jgi:hypothetical protein
MHVGHRVMLLELPPPDERTGLVLPGLAVGDIGRVTGICDCCGLCRVRFEGLGEVWLMPTDVTQCH